MYSQLEGHGCKIKAKILYDLWNPIVVEETLLEKVDDFILPEKWCVKRNENNFSIINEWFKKNTTGNQWIYCNDINYLYNTSLTGKFLTTSSFILNGYVEITFEQFKICIK